MVRSRPEVKIVQRRAIVILIREISRYDLPAPRDVVKPHGASGSTLFGAGGY